MRAYAITCLMLSGLPLTIASDASLLRAPQHRAVQVKDPGYTPKKAKVVFNDSSATGTVTMTQENWQAPVTMLIEFANLRSDMLPTTMRLHGLPVTKGCKRVGPFYDPLALGVTNTTDGYIGSRVGPIASEQYGNQVVTSDITLYGFNSIVGRSLVLYGKRGSPVACGTVELQDVKFKAARADFKGQLVGYVMMVQEADNPHADTIILMDLAMNDTSKSHTNGSMSVRQLLRSDMQVVSAHPAKDESAGSDGGVTYMIADGKFARATDGVCTGVQASYNPTRAPACTPENTSPFMPCAVGEIYGRHGSISLPANNDRTVYFTDFVPLSGDSSVVGKSFVVQVGGKTTFCAPIKEINNTFPLQ